MTSFNVVSVTTEVLLVVKTADIEKAYNSVGEKKMVVYVTPYKKTDLWYISVGICEHIYIFKQGG